MTELCTCRDAKAVVCGVLRGDPPPTCPQQTAVTGAVLPIALNSDGLGAVLVRALIEKEVAK